VALRLLLLMAVTSAGPAGAASSWHLLDQQGDHLAAGVERSTPSVAADPGQKGVGEHCAICQFGAALRAFLPSPAEGMAAPSHDLAVHSHVSLTQPDDPTATGHSGRAPPSAG
jgi:hypothetical protein